MEFNEKGLLLLIMPFILIFLTKIYNGEEKYGSS